MIARLRRYWAKLTGTAPIDWVALSQNEWARQYRRDVEFRDRTLAPWKYEQ